MIAKALAVKVGVSGTSVVPSVQVTVGVSTWIALPVVKVVQAVQAERRPLTVTSRQRHLN